LCNEVTIYPEKQRAVIWNIIRGYDEVTEARSGEHIVLNLVHKEDNADTRRGNIIAYANSAPVCGREFEATVCWLDTEAALQTGREYFLRMNAMETRCKITEVVYKIDVNSFAHYNDGSAVAVNEFARVRIETADVIAYNAFDVLPARDNN